MEDKKRGKEMMEMELNLTIPLIESLKEMSDFSIEVNETALEVSHTELQHRRPGFAPTELDLLNWEGVDDTKVEDEVEDLKSK